MPRPPGRSADAEQLIAGAGVPGLRYLEYMEKVIAVEPDHPSAWSLWGRYALLDPHTRQGVAGRRQLGVAGSESVDLENVGDDVGRCRRRKQTG